MVFCRDYEVHLRVFEPVAAHAEYAAAAVEANHDRVAALVSNDADERLLSMPADPVPQSLRSAPVFLTGAEAGDGIDRVCPVQADIRGWEAIGPLVDGLSKTALETVLPKASRRAAAAAHAAWLQSEPDMRIFTKTARWCVPPEWWLAFGSDEDLRIEDLGQPDAGDCSGPARVRIRVPIMTASARADWARDVIAENSSHAGLIDRTQELAAWLDSFDFNSILELDLGGLAGVMEEAQMRSHVDDWLTAHEAGDRAAAVDAYVRYSHLHDRCLLLARSN